MNIGRLLTATAEHFPEHPGVSWGGRTLTYREFNDRVNSLAAAFGEMGLARGDRVAFVMGNRPELLEILFGSFKCGLCAVPLNAGFVADEIAYHVQDSAAAVLAFGPEHRDTMMALRDRLPTVHDVVAVGGGDESGEGPAPAHGYEQLLAAHRGAPEGSTDARDDDVCWLFYTSGTTGRPKGAMLTHGNLLFVTVSWLADLMPLDVDDVTLHAAPLTHGAGFHALAATARGAHQVIAEGQRFDATRLLELIEDAGVTNTWMVPTQVMRLVTAQLSRPHDLSRLRWILYGGAPFHEEDLRQAVEVLGPVLIQVYAQGETPMTGSYLPPRAHLDNGKPGVLTSAGYARTGMEVTIHDQEDREVPCGEVGEIVIRGPTVMKGYWERVAESEETLRGGWLHTGDLGRMDEHGYVYVLDRTKDLIISGGANVYAREVEEVLLLHRDVAAAAVFGVPDRQWGERVVAAIVLRKSVQAVDAEVLREHCRRRMAGYKRPKEFYFMTEFPVSAFGKVLKKELRRRFAGPSGAAEGGGG